MRAALLTLLLVTALAFPRAAHAEAESPEGARTMEPTPSGFRVGLRSGVGVPIGRAFASGTAMRDTISAYVPLRLDVGYRITPHFYVGVNGQLASLVSNACAGDMQCSGTNARFGVGGAYHLLPSRRIDPWLALGVGYETLSVSRTSDGRTADFTAQGVELVNVELGVDWRASRSLRLGPALSSSIGRYTQIAVNGARATDFDTTAHAWVMLGVRGAFDM